MTKKSLGPGVDPAGSIYIERGKVFREISSEAQETMRMILGDSQFHTHLAQGGMIETELVKPSRGMSGVLLRHKKIDFVSYYLEWSFDMLKDAAITTLRLTKELAAKELTLKDAHPYNILFDYMKPAFIDVSSIVHGPLKDSWNRGFWGEFIIPLLLMKTRAKSLQSMYFYWENVPSQKILLTRILFHRRLLQFLGIRDQRNIHTYFTKLERLVSRMALEEYHTRWEDYYLRDGFQEQVKGSALSDKERSALLLLGKLRRKNQQTLVDIASNEGWFALEAARLGYDVVAFDYDERAINNLYRKHRGTGTHILPLVMDFRQPTKTHGIDGVWKSAGQRLKCDVSLSMAVIHHLALTQNVSFEVFRNRLLDFTRHHAIVEFIGRDDVHVQKWLQGKEWYTENNFLRCMSQRFTLESTLPSNLPTRKIFLFKTKE